MQGGSLELFRNQKVKKIRAESKVMKIKKGNGHKSNPFEGTEIICLMRWERKNRYIYRCKTSFKKKPRKKKVEKKCQVLEKPAMVLEQVPKGLFRACDLGLTLVWSHNTRSLID